jgi:thiamine-monophosphate kinase
MTEKEKIEKILSCFPKSRLHYNQFFESDAEVFSYKNNTLLFTTDDYSSEDLFRDNDPFQLGKNISIATISDILASGGEPIFYSHSMIVSKKWNDNFIVEFSKGVADTVKSVHANFLGGDFGTSENWHYTGIALGEVKKPLSRIGAKPGDAVYFTGKAGAGNLEAALYLYSDNILIHNLVNSYKTKFHCRLNEAKLIRNYASSCIDTSDGVFNGINTICNLNKCGFHLNRIPVLPEAKIAAKILGKPQELLIIGECGEYELLFTIPPEQIENFEKEVKTMQYDINRIGTIKEKDIKIIIFGKKELKLNNYTISARSFNSTKEYLAGIIEFIKSDK